MMWTSLLKLKKTCLNGATLTRQENIFLTKTVRSPPLTNPHTESNEIFCI